MQGLNLPQIELKIVNRKGKYLVWDVFRKKYLVITPEEWVRQHLLHHLMLHYQYPKNSISVECSINVNGLIKRYDALIFDKNHQPCLIVECKAPEIPISQNTIDQSSIYNLAFGVKYVLLSNGIEHLMLRVDHEQKMLFLMDDVLTYEVLTA